VSEPTVIPPRQGEVIGDAPDRRVEILSECAPLHATWSRFGPGREGADLHVHREHTDLFYVLEGELTVRLGPEGSEVRVPAGTLARVPRLVVHGFRNGSDAEVRYLNLHAPGRRFADYLRAMRDGREFAYDQHDPPADGGRSITEAVIGGDGRLLADVDDIRVEVINDPQPTESDPHYRSLYVLDGVLALTVDGADLSAEAGTWIQVPPGTPHRTGGGRYLRIRTPG
jgi:quercetin dioxygenase-like cupin family protein